MVLLFGAGSLDVAALVTPLALIALPCVDLIAALSLLFESVPWLRGGMGNVVYFLLFLGLITVTPVPPIQWVSRFRIGHTQTVIQWYSTNTEASAGTEPHGDRQVSIPVAPSGKRG